MSPDRAPVGALFRRFRERLATEGSTASAAGRARRPRAEGERRRRDAGQVAGPPAGEGVNGSRATGTGAGMARTDAGAAGAGRRHCRPRRRARGAAAAPRPQGGGGEQLNVPPAEFTSYYGRPILKAPVWKWDIAAYLFTGGLAAGSSLLAAGGQLTGRPALRRAGRWSPRPRSAPARTSWSTTWASRAGSTTCCGWPS